MVLSLVFFYCMCVLLTCCNLLLCPLFFVPPTVRSGFVVCLVQYTLRPPISSSEGLFGGACLGVKGPDCIVFFDWNEGVMIRKIDILPKEVIFFWIINLVLVFNLILNLIFVYEAEIYFSLMLFFCRFIHIGVSAPVLILSRLYRLNPRLERRNSRTG